VSGESFGEWHGDCVPDLAGDFDLGSTPQKVVVESLYPGRLVVADGPVLDGMQVAALLWLEKFGADCLGRPVPAEPSEDIM
jgi:hypothetical protein